jgi:superfamily II DNA or RNA helicase
MTITFILPELVYGPRKYSVGYVQQLIRKETEVTIVSTDQIAIGPRSKIDRHHLSNGERVVITTKTKIELPDEVDGVLRKKQDGTLLWLEHRQLNAVMRDIAVNGLSSRARAAAATWIGKFSYLAQEIDATGKPILTGLGLRPPQLGALFSIGSHWSLRSEPATVVMPTGTGKTETMLSVMASQRTGPMLVAVPSKALRGQTAKKFVSLGLLQKLGLLPTDIEYPVVGVLTNQPKSITDLAIFEDCNVVVAVIQSLTGGTAKALAKNIADRVDVLVVDEAHHVAASTWSAFREEFANKRVLQFTATPFRGDGKLVDGDVIFSYPLRRAQEDGYFKPIKFVPVHELGSQADDVIAQEACKQLKADIAAGYDHLMMARCDTIKRAEDVHSYYLKHGKEFKPIIVHSELKDADERVEKLKKSESRIAVCVNMLGEGFDLPSLKVAALHDPQKSLGPFLQFTGRFTRTASANLGDATVIANIADPGVSIALERLYSEDADWNALLSEMSSAAAREHAQLIEFLNQSETLGEALDDAPNVSHHLLRPVMSAITFRCPTFTPKKFHEGLNDESRLVKVWLNSKSNTLFFVTRKTNRPRWVRSKDVIDVEWDIFILHYDTKQKLLFLGSSDKTSNHGALAKAVGATDQISGEEIFRSLGGIGRLVFTNLGVSKHGRKNLSFAMYTGQDVRTALGLAEKAGSRKAVLNGTGWEDGKKVTFGCSYKGRVWSKEAGTIPQFNDWAERVGKKLVDTSIDTKNIIDNVLIPEEVTSVPTDTVLGMEWPDELLRISEDRIDIIAGTVIIPFYDADIRYVSTDVAKSAIFFEIIDNEGEVLAAFELLIGGSNGYAITRTSKDPVYFEIGTKHIPIENFFEDYTPLVRFVDLSELDGNLMLKTTNPSDMKIPNTAFDPWDWKGVDITKESIWKEGVQRKDSVQWAVAQAYLGKGYDVVFDDDGAGEAADLVCLKEENDHIKVALIHCKFSGGGKAGVRIKDIVEVASQGVRSAKWSGRFKELCKHLVMRQDKRVKRGITSLLSGTLLEVGRLAKASRTKEVRYEVILVQPGVSKADITPDQRMVFAAASSYLKETIAVDVVVVCSA